MSNERIEGIMSNVAAPLVLFTTMLDPMLSVALATTLLVALACNVCSPVAAAKPNRRPGITGPALIKLVRRNEFTAGSRYNPDRIHLTKVLQRALAHDA